MEKLIAELTRLYLLDGQLLNGEIVTPAMLDQQLCGAAAVALPLVSEAGTMRTIVLHFDSARAGKGEQQWEALCAIANALQHRLELPAPAVSISGDDGYALWLSLATPVPVAQARRFAALLRTAHGSDAPVSAEAPADASATALLPPCVHPASGKWAAFIHPGMGSSFADEPRLEMAPPLAAQAAFLESLKSATSEQFAQALETLERGHVETAPQTPAPPAPANPARLLKDATLDEIVQWLHERNIEPTFRHLIGKPASKG